MIKTGTICMVHGLSEDWNRRYNGLFCTITGPEFEYEGLGPYYGLPIRAMVYPVEFQTTKVFTMCCARNLKPIDDPDQWAKDPEWTIRPRETVDA